MAFEADPRRRYATALEFAEDLARARTGENTKARPSTALTRTWRQIRRQPWPSATSALAAALLITAVILKWERRSAVQSAVEDAFALPELFDFWNKGEDGAPRLVAIVRSYFTDAEMASARSDLGSRHRWERIYRERVIERHRAVAGDHLISPRATVASPTPTFRFRRFIPDPESYDYQLVIYDADLNPLPPLLIPGTTTADGDIISFTLPEARALAGFSTRAAPFRWKVKLIPKTGHASIDLNVAPVEFAVVSPDSRDRLLSSAKPTGSDSNDRLLRAFALLNSGLAIDALQALDSFPASAGPDGTRACAFLRSWAHALLGDAEKAAQYHDDAYPPQRQ
jgi:hypothetical protein